MWGNEFVHGLLKLCFLMTRLRLAFRFYNTSFIIMKAACRYAEY